MSKAIIIAAVGSLLILCIGAQFISLNGTKTDRNLTNNYTALK